jgi:hypothetical protein
MTYTTDLNSNQTNVQLTEKKEKKKKKKMSAYKKLLRSIKTSKKTEKQEKEDYRRKISQSLGGGKFNKIDTI